MTCCSLLVAATLLASQGEPPVGAFSPMFLRGEPIWITRVSRRQLLLKQKETEKPRPVPPETDVAFVAA